MCIWSFSRDSKVSSPHCSYRKDSKSPDCSYRKDSKSLSSNTCCISPPVLRSLLLSLPSLLPSLFALVQEMMTKLITETPDHPIPFLISHLQSKQESPGKLQRALSGSAALWADTSATGKSVATPDMLQKWYINREIILDVLRTYLV